MRACNGNESGQKCRFSLENEGCMDIYTVDQRLVSQWEVDSHLWPAVEGFCLWAVWKCRISYWLHLWTWALGGDRLIKYSHIRVSYLSVTAYEASPYRYKWLFGFIYAWGTWHASTANLLWLCQVSLWVLVRSRYYLNR